MSNDKIDHWYQVGKDNGAAGGKLCFVPGTLVKTESGYSPIEDIRPGDRVYDCRYILQYVHEVMSRDYDGQILQFTIRGLDVPLSVTPDHPLMTTMKHPRNRREFGRKIVNLPIFKPASAFEKGDVFLLPIDDTVEDIEYIDYPTMLETPKYSNRFLYEGFPHRIPVDERLLRLIGWYAAEGSRSTGQIFFSLNRDESSVASQIIDDLGVVFTKTAVSAPGQTPQSIYVRCSSTALSQLMFDLCGDMAEEKHLPNFVMKLPLLKQFVVLRALWLGDGCRRYAYDTRTGHSEIRCNYKTTSTKLAKQVQKLCLRLGFVCSLKHEDSSPRRILKNRNISVPKRTFIVSIYGDDAKAFQESMLADKVVPVVRRNNKRLSLRKEFVRIEGALYSKASIAKIELKHYEGRVHNLGVEGSHTYIAGDVAVHNCGAGGGGFLMLYCENGRAKLRKAMAAQGLVEHRFRFDFDGSKVIYNV